MSCPICGTEYTQAGNSDEGYVRSICSCEREQKCFKCKRGDFHPVNQALLDLDLEVRHYACSTHGHLEAESFPVPEAFIKSRAAPKAAPVKDKVAPSPSPKAPPKEKTPKHDYSTFDGFKAELAESREFVICIACRVEQKFCNFEVRAGDSGLPVPYCPKCKTGRPQFQGKTW